MITFSHTHTHTPPITIYLSPDSVLSTPFTLDIVDEENLRGSFSDGLHPVSCFPISSTFETTFRPFTDDSGDSDVELSRVRLTAREKSYGIFDHYLMCAGPPFDRRSSEQTYNI